MSKIRKAVIPAAGLGTRFLPATKAQPKEMLNVVDKPAIQYIIEEAVDAGIEEILIITGRNKKSMEDHFDISVELEQNLIEKNKIAELEMVRRISEMTNIHYIRQKQPLGLGHAVYCARTFVGDEPFAVMLGDDIIDAEIPCIAQLMEVYEEKQIAVLGVQTVPKEHVGRYGIVCPGREEDRQTEVLDLVEKPAISEAPSQLAVLGRYILDADIFPLLEQTNPGAGGEIQLTDALKKYLKTKPIIAYDFIGKRYDIGDKLGFLEATVEFALNRRGLGEEFYLYLKKLLKEIEQKSNL